MFSNRVHTATTFADILKSSGIMVKFFALCMAIACVAAKTDVSSWKKPSFCRGLDCPEYMVVNQTKDYEIRRYAPSAWVSTNMTGTDYGSTGSIMFRKLFNYIQGKNSKSMKIAMTAPVLRKIIPGQGPTCASTFTEHFYLSKDVAANAPVPSDPTVYISKFPEVTMYVRSFKGFARTEQTWIEEAQNLAVAIGNTSLYETRSWFTAGYDSPFTFLNRHNEVMFLKHN